MDPGVAVDCGWLVNELIPLAWGRGELPPDAPPPHPLNIKATVKITPMCFIQFVPSVNVQIVRRGLQAIEQGVNDSCTRQTRSRITVVYTRNPMPYTELVLAHQICTEANRDGVESPCSG